MVEERGKLGSHLLLSMKPCRLLITRNSTLNRLVLSSMFPCLHSDITANYLLNWRYASQMAGSVSKGQSGIYKI